jgi:hypothetical protein
MDNIGNDVKRLLREFVALRITARQIVITKPKQSNSKALPLVGGDPAGTTNSRKFLPANPQITTIEETD